MSNVDVLEATESFATEIDGQLYNVGAGTTRVSADHPLAQRYPQHFRPVEEGLTYRTEEATAEPDRPRQRVRARQTEPKSLPQEPAAEDPQRPTTKPPEQTSDQPPAPPSGLSSQSIQKETK